MKTCPKCNTTGIPDYAKFCPICGAKMDIFASIQLREISFLCAFDYDPATKPGKIKISQDKIEFEWGTFISIFSLGFEKKVVVKYREITSMGIVHRRMFNRRMFNMLCIEDYDGYTHYFSGQSWHRNKEVVKQLTYLIELYRRMYWWYDEYKSENTFGHAIVPLKRFDNAKEDMAFVSNDELINFYISKYQQ